MRDIMQPMSTFFEKWKNGLSKTRKTAFGRIANFIGASEVNDQLWEDLEALFIQADLGVETTMDVVENLRQRAAREGITRSDELLSLIRDTLISYLPSPPERTFPEKPTVILITGVNGSGKTTTIAKLGKRFLDEGKNVLFGAADTYRAAAIDQIKIWGERLGVPVIAGQPQADPGAVAYDTIQSARSRKIDIVLIDTAGRLHTRYNLMEELKKVHRVVGKALPGAPHASWLVMDATTGQNALHQARAFHEAIELDGVILAKLDSSSRGGMAFAIQKELHLPILYVGLGETLLDLEVFNPEAFIEGLLADY